MLAQASGMRSAPTSSRRVTTTLTIFAGAWKVRTLIKGDFRRTCSRLEVDAILDAGDNVGTLSSVGAGSGAGADPTEMYSNDVFTRDGEHGRPSWHQLFQPSLSEEGFQRRFSLQPIGRKPFDEEDIILRRAK